ncbi:MAG TPA: PIN domain-containing protein [Aurantimonas coralicida]|uniref:Ribonuclease VapC n=2 Tax=root TaxID=1 RepID=A0A9C9NJN2_9HYPH|nr:PIN domain-containing protein [Aurantimonas coralicida]HEU03081.1 PIN domain-containing protein [Aurantimonas coralicida]
MMIDASAIVAILNREPDAERLKRAIEEADSPLYTSPLALFEATLGLARAKCDPRRRPTAEEIAAADIVVLEFVKANTLEVVAVGPQTAARALRAAATYGKIVGHPADLNFGDCFIYASAKEIGARLLYTGNDFAKTDLA